MSFFPSARQVKADQQVAGELQLNSYGHRSLGFATETQEVFTGSSNSGLKQHLSMADQQHLSSQADQDRLDLLRTDLDLCFTFADLIITELGLQDREAAEGLLAKAEQGYATIEYFLPKVCNEAEHQALQQRLHQLRARLDSVAGQIRANL
jgi:hypothetical protein